MQYEFMKTAIDGVIQIVPFRSSDRRGDMVKEFSREEFLRHGIAFFPQEALCIQSRRGVLRGLHFQHTKEQEKLVRCIMGNIWSVVVDIRKESRTFGKWIRTDINQDREILIPKGCAFGTLALEDSLLSCICSEKYYGKYDSGIFWNDPTLAISWPLDEIGGEAIISEKDRGLQSFLEYKDSQRKEG